MVVPPPRQLPARIGIEPLCVITSPPSRYQADSMSPSIWVIFEGSGFPPFSSTTTLFPACANTPATTPPPAPLPAPPHPPPPPPPPRPRAADHDVALEGRLPRDFHRGERRRGRRGDRQRPGVAHGAPRGVGAVAL